MYQFHLGDIILPVAPERMTVKINNNNKTLSLINEGEINILKDPRLTDISFDALFPNVRLSFSQYPSGFQNAGYYLNVLERYKTSKEPIQFVVSRTLPNGRRLFDTSMKCSIEEYQLKEDANNTGFDVVASIKLKQYVDYSVKTYKVNADSTVSVSKSRETVNSPAPKTSEVQYTIRSGDTLWEIAKKYYGDGSQYPKLASYNGVSDPNRIPVGTVISIPIL